LRRGFSQFTLCATRYVGWGSSSPPASRQEEEKESMRRLAQGLFGLAANIVSVILAVWVGAIGAAIGFVIGLLIFGALGLEGWPLAVPVLIVAAVGFAVGALLVWGFVATVGDVGDAIGRKLRDDQNDKQ
jgi:hypothetical protein